MIPFNRSWVEIDLDAIVHNFKEIKKITTQKTKIMAVVKADAYGHGAIEVSKTLLEQGTDMLAVAMLDEAIQLRKAGIDAPILILGHTIPEKAPDIIQFNLIQTIFQMDIALALSKAASQLKTNAKIHIKVDTGMTRVGFRGDVIHTILQIAKLPHIELQGLYTHFASADDLDPAYTLMQHEKFMHTIKALTRNGLEVPMYHACNTAGMIQFPQMHMDIVRPGIALYGLYPSKHVNQTKLSLQPAMTFKARAVMVKDVEPNIGVSYGTIFTTKRHSRIVTIPVGYADGYTRLLTNKGAVLVNQQRAPIVGKICMDQCMVDITDVKGSFKLGDEVILFGKQNACEIHVDEIAEIIGTVNYEIICMVGNRIPRMYKRNGQFVGEMNYLI